jgi:hypothetical protein
MQGGGHSVAVVDIGILLRRNGVLDRLKSEGIAVAGPMKSVSNSQNTAAH